MTRLRNLTAFACAIATALTIAACGGSHTIDLHASKTTAQLTPAQLEAVQTHGANLKITFNYPVPHEEVFQCSTQTSEPVTRCSAQNLDDILDLLQQAQEGQSPSCTSNDYGPEQIELQGYVLNGFIDQTVARTNSCLNTIYNQLVGDFGNSPSQSTSITPQQLYNEISGHDDGSNGTPVKSKGEHPKLPPGVTLPHHPVARHIR